MWCYRLQLHQPPTLNEWLTDNQSIVVSVWRNTAAYLSIKGESFPSNIQADYYDYTLNGGMVCL